MGSGGSGVLSDPQFHIYLLGKLPRLMEVGGGAGVGVRVLWRPEGQHGRYCMDVVPRIPSKYQVTYELWEATDHLPSLQVGLSIQIGSLDVAQSIRVTGGQQQNVRRDDLIAAETHKISHSDFFPESIHILLFLPGKETAINKTGRKWIIPESVWWAHTAHLTKFLFSGMLKISIIKTI